jgi:hypothetical protein
MRFKLSRRCRDGGWFLDVELLGGRWVRHYPKVRNRSYLSVSGWRRNPLFYAGHYGRSRIELLLGGGRTATTDQPWWQVTYLRFTFFNRVWVWDPGVWHAPPQPCRTVNINCPKRSAAPHCECKKRGWL